MELDAGSIEVEKQIDEFEAKRALPAADEKPVMYCTAEFVESLADHIWGVTTAEKYAAFVADMLADVEAGTAEVCGVRLRKRTIDMSGSVH